MSYSDLPPEERIARASEYAVLLVADNKETEVILQELQQVFNLDHAQALQAYEKMRTERSTDYNTTISRNMYASLGFIGFAAFVAVVYFFLGKGMGNNAFGTGALIFAGIFVLAGIGNVGLVFRNLWEKYNHRSASQVRESFTLDEEGGKKTYGTVGLVLLGMIMAVITVFIFLNRSGTVDVANLATVDRLVLYSTPQEVEYSSGKHKSYYYTFSFYENIHTFIFKDKYYKYGNGIMHITALKAGDTISLQLEEDQRKLAEDPYTANQIKVVNFTQNGIPCIDHHYRNAAIEKDNKKTMWIGLSAFAGCLIFFFVSNLYARSK